MTPRASVSPAPVRPRSRWRIARRIAAGLAVTLIGLAVWAFAVEPAGLRTAETDILLPGRAAALDGVRIAVLADLHAGAPWVGLDALGEVVDATLAAQPDLILIPGDLVATQVVGGTVIEPQALEPALARLDAPLGVYAVLGNHDWWYDGPVVAAALQRAGISVLEDTAAVVPGGAFWVAGISDLWEAAHDIDRALAPVPAGAPVIAFTHNPDVFPDVPARVALTVAGHTHGGQVDLPVVGRLVVPSAFGERFAAGHVREGGRDLVVSTGIGTSLLPVRFRVPPEVTVLTLRTRP